MVATPAGTTRSVDILQGSVWAFLTGPVPPGTILTAITPGPTVLDPPPEPAIVDVAGIGSIWLIADPGAPAIGLGGSILLASLFFEVT